MTSSPDQPVDLYAQAGVDTTAEETGMASLTDWVTRTFAFRPGIGRPVLPIGHFANVIDLGAGRGLAISTDGVGTKILVAEMMHRYDTIGIDCIAMNVNDVLCVGAEPLALVDSVAVQHAHPELLRQIAAGLYEGARQARISIPGGEVAQIREIVTGVRDGWSFDLVGTCVGLVDLDKIIVGRRLAPGDAVIGLASSGVHSNGLTLARRVLFSTVGYRVNDHLPRLGRTIGEELLEPTRIYVPEVMEMLGKLDVKAMAHVTSDGLLNLLRVESDLGFLIDNLPETPAIFQLVQEAGQVSVEEMYQVFNMGIGYCVTVPAGQAEEAIAISQRHGTPAWRIGVVTDDFKKQVHLVQPGLIGEGNSFRPA